MEFLTRLPVVGPLVARVLRSRPYRVYEHFTATKGNRLAGAITFFGFLALFPLLTVALAIAVAALTPGRVEELQKRIADQLPGLSDSLDLNALVANAGTVGAISGVLLLLSGLGWVDTMRGAIRDVWLLPEETANPVLRKAWDCLVLFGLGLVSLFSLAASAAGTTLAGKIADQLGLDRGGPGGYLLSAVGLLIAIASDMVLFAYLLAPFPRITDQRRRSLVEGALIGAVGFELLKLLLASYLGSVAGRSLYGAFGVPVALLLWINFVCRLLMYCVSWTALADPEAARERAREHARRALAAVDEDRAGAAGGAAQP
ncbi:YihY/virulence factor BrkB family protein [Kitasatospora sp. NBC_00240]|uniref:YihY/virulence factor BrkB family protein n=1 Tax=Kitasatospora sp. NBC_00240 TaxID=2903567 RepID=UPI0022500AA4|nr:YihY/virulence factor BrkB family protein [Kitasatospora sp. NBC_00240]MCX5212489.1 YihY/virulence factor BrkB family protein [Kitasatospora sp. NBC_00240]